MREKMLEIADRLDKRAEAIFNNLYRKYERELELRVLQRKDGQKVDYIQPPKSQMAGALVIMAEEIRETLEKVAYREYDGGGELFTVEKFSSAVGSGAFIDSDGVGYYAKEHPGKRTEMMLESSLSARPSRIGGGDVNKKFTHVVWYNK